MAQGDTFDVSDGDEIELTFQLNIRLAEIKKRRDAAQLTHVQIDFATDAGTGVPVGAVKFTALGADVKGDPEVNEVLPVTEDNQSFTRLYRVGPIRMFDPTIGRVGMSVFVKAFLCAADGTSSQLIPRNGRLCTLRVKP